MMTKMPCVVILLVLCAVSSVFGQDIDPEFIQKFTTTESHSTTKSVGMESTTTESETSTFTTEGFAPTTEPPQTTAVPQTEPNTTPNAPEIETESPSTSEDPTITTESQTERNTTPSVPESETQLSTTTETPNVTMEPSNATTPIVPVYKKPSFPVHTRPILPRQLVSCQVRSVKHSYISIYGVNHIYNVCSYCCYYHFEGVERCRRILPYFCRIC